MAENLERARQRVEERLEATRARMAGLASREEDHGDEVGGGRWSEGSRSNYSRST